jgi:hypothetical protein
LQPSTKTSHTPATTSSTSTRRDDPAHRTDFSLSAADYTQNHGSTAPILPQTNFSSSGAPEPAATVGAIPQPSVGAIPQTSDSRPRFCTVKGCKAIIVESTGTFFTIQYCTFFTEFIEVYPYKMCQPCRSRYRNYGITKRAKWKTEREAFHRELEGLRAKEDLRRAANGLPVSAFIVFMYMSNVARSRFLIHLTTLLLGSSLSLMNKFHFHPVTNPRLPRSLFRPVCVLSPTATIFYRDSTGTSVARRIESKIVGIGERRLMH